MNEQTDAPATPQPDVPLAVEIRDALAEAFKSEEWKGGSLKEFLPDAHARQAAAVMELLLERGHVLPGAPPAQRILEDAQSFASRLTLSNLACRIVITLRDTPIDTPESKPAREWIDDYLEGKNHGPIGKPMLWPGKLPGMAHMLREWGFVPTIATPGQPSFVAKPVANPTRQ